MADDSSQHAPDSRENSDHDLAGAPEEQAIEQRAVQFMGDELAAAMTESGNIYIAFPGMCVALGLNVRGQTQRVQRTRTLSHALRRIPIETQGGVQRINCLRLDMIALWLAGVQTSQLKPEFRPKIEAYQDELAPVAMQVFLRVAGLSTTQLVPASADPQVAALAEQIDTLTGIVTFLREHMDAALAVSGQVASFSLRLDQAIGLLESLAERQETTETHLAATETQLARIDERTQRLTPAHARAVQESVDRLVRETKRLPIPLTYAMVYGSLKQRFRAGSYREIADECYEAVMAFIRDLKRRATQGEAPEQGALF